MRRVTSVERMARTLGVSPYTVAALENGGKAGAETVAKVVRALVEG